MSREPRSAEQVLDDLEDGMATLISEARVLLDKVRDQVDGYEGALDALEEGVWGMRPPKIEPNQWALLMPFMQAARIDSVRKAMKGVT
jgi:hypothetical protein